MTEQQKTQLIQRALEACKQSYSPYSDFCVGAALLAKDGRIFCGCNIENATYTPTICAERVALFTAVYNGAKAFEAIAVVGGPKGDCQQLCPPCGVCRQALREFCDDDFEVILGQENLQYKTYKLSELLPLSFSKNNLG